MVCMWHLFVTIKRHLFLFIYLNWLFIVCMYVFSYVVSRSFDVLLALWTINSEINVLDRIKRWRSTTKSYTLTIKYNISKRCFYIGTITAIILKFLLTVLTKLVFYYIVIWVHMRKNPHLYSSMLHNKWHSIVIICIYNANYKRNNIFMTYV